MIAPNKTRIRRWIKELRSGKYKQGQKALATVNPIRGEERLCCLGLACAIHNGAVSPKVSRWQDEAYTSAKEDRWDIWPAEVRRWFGIPPRYTNRLVAKNDAGQAFGQIADYLQEEFL